MVSTSNLDEKFNRVRKNFCFYLDIQDHGLARSLSRRIQDMGLQQEVFLTSRVSHVIRSRPAPAAACARRDGRRADAMLQRVRPEPPTQPSHRYVTLTVQKAISLLDKLYDTFFAASRKSHVRVFTKHFIKIEFLDKLCRPVVKEFDEWPTISLEPDPPREKKKDDSLEQFTNNNLIKTPEKMTRKSRPRIKEKEEKEPKGGYCEMCNADYADAVVHRRSPHHLSFVRDHANFISLDSLISAGADVATFLDKAAPLNGERRSQRKICNGDAETPRSKRSKRSQSPDSTTNGSPRRNGFDDDKKHNTRCSKKTEEDRQYYKVVGVSTKLRSSGGFNSAKPKESPPTVNGAKPLVVKFRKVRRSELSVLSDEAEQFMFPKRASSTSSTSSDDTDDDKVLSPRKTPPKPPPPSTERRRLARPIALKEESSEEDSWPEDNRKRKRRAPLVVKRARRVLCKAVSEPAETKAEQPEPTPIEIENNAPQEVEIAITEEAPKVSPLRETKEKCMKWEDGRLKYTPAVEQLEFAFESVPAREPWFEAFKRQDEEKVVTRNVPQYFALYSTKSPKLPYEIGQLPPLKPNCCPLSDLVKQRHDKPGPSRSYGTRGMKKIKIRKRTAMVQALESHSRKSPREHASTLAILGGLVNRRKLADDTKSTASEDTISDTQSNVRIEPVLSETQEASERLQQFLSEVFEDAGEFELSEGVVEGGAHVTTSNNMPDVSSLVSECEDCDLIRNELKEVTERPKGRRGKFKKKNKTGWPSKRKNKKDSRTNSVESQKTESLDRSSAEPPDDETTQEMISEEEENRSEAEEKTIVAKSDEDSHDDKTLTEDSVSHENMDVDSSDNKLLIDLKVLVDDEKKADEEVKGRKKSRSSSDDDKELRKKKRVLASLCEWKQPVVRVARVDATARWLRSAGRGRSRYRL